LKVSEENFDYSQKKDNVVNSFGIVIGHSGQGEAIVSNRIPGIRAAVYYGGPKEIITLSREHNNANILSLGANFLSNEEALESVLLWLQTKFTEESRHQRRNELLDSIS
jgi:ribose 5-phosphate isomerase B